MPKARKAGSMQTLFSVSPWQNKVVEDIDDDSSCTRGGQTYNVIEQPLVTQTEAAGNQYANVGDAELVSKHKMHASKRACRGFEASTLPQSDSPRWRAKKQKSDCHPLELFRAEQMASSQTLLENITREEDRMIAQDVFEGTAVLAILPNQSITGHLLPRIGRRSSIGIMGLEMLSYRDCTRDAEWRLLHMTALDFSSRRETAFLVERTEGDAMRLRAPVQWQGAEASTMEQLSKGCQQDMRLQFDCEQLLVDEAADRELRAVQPRLCGKCAIVNIGKLYMEWPKRDITGGGAACSKPSLLNGPAVEQQRTVSPSMLKDALGGTRTIIDDEVDW